MPITIPRHAPQVVEQVLAERMRTHQQDYAVVSAPRSPRRGLTGNKTPGFSRLQWLRGRSKCNQFVGDILTLLGLEMPTYRMKDKTLHYVNAEGFSKFGKHFQRITSIQEVQAGDVLVTDYTAKQGENGAHAEIVEKVHSNALSLLGAGVSGIRRIRKNIGSLGTYVHDRAHFRSKSAISYFLRPIKLLNSSD